MASPTRCFTVPTSTLYASSEVTNFFTNTFAAIATLADGSTTEVLSLDVDSEVQTQVVPTATLYATQCAATSAASITTTRQATRTALTRMTLETSSTQAGGNVVIATIIRTISSAEVVVETQTIAPEPVQSQDALLTQGQGQHHTDAGAIAGGIVGAVAALGLLAACLWFVRKRRRNANATRNLDDFFSNPAAGTGSDSSTGGTAAGGTRARRTSTLRSFRRQSMSNIVDLEKEQKASAEHDGNHWATLAPQLDDILDVDDHDDGDNMVQRQNSLPPTYGRAQSRQSMHTISRPMSFHSMSMGGVDEADLSPEGPVGSDIMYTTAGTTADQGLLLRNDSDRSSASAASPNDVVKPMVARSFDLLPPALFNSSSPPPLSPTSPYGSPPLREMTLQEGVAYEGAPPPSSPTSLNARPTATFDDGRPRITRGANLSMNGGGVLQHVGVAAAHSAAKPRSWSSSAVTVPDRPKSALGLSGGQQQPQPRMSPFLTGSGMGMTPYDSSSALQQSPPQSPPLGPSAPSSLRGRGSLNGGQAQHASPAYHKNMRQQQRSPPPFASPQKQQSYLPATPSSPNGRASSPTDYPPSQYAHLDVYKTEEERAEDRRHAFATASNNSGSFSRMSSQHRPQRRHRSLSGDLLLRIANADSPPLTPAIATADEASKQRRMLSVRNIDAETSAAAS